MFCCPKCKSTECIITYCWDSDWYVIECTKCEFKDGFDPYDAYDVMLPHWCSFRDTVFDDDRR